MHKKCAQSWPITHGCVTGMMMFLMASPIKNPSVVLCFVSVSFMDGVFSYFLGIFASLYNFSFLKPTSS